MQVRYTGYRDRPQEERIVRFQNSCREGHTEIAFAATGTNLQLVFSPPTNGYMPDKECDFDKEPGKVSHVEHIENKVGTSAIEEENVTNLVFQYSNSINCV